MADQTFEELQGELEQEFSDLKELIQILKRLLYREIREAQDRSITRSRRNTFKQAGIFDSNMFLGTYQNNPWIPGIGGINNSIVEKKEMMHLDRVFHKYPAIIWSSLFLNTYSVLEFALYNICKRLGQQRKFPLDLKDLSHKGINLYKIYFSKVCGLNLQLGKDQTWEYLQAINSLRNVIIHNNGYAKNRAKQLEKLDEKGLRIDDLGFVELNHQFNYAVVEIVEEFVGKVFEAIQREENSL